MSKPDDYAHSVGLWQEFFLALHDAHERAYEAPFPIEDVADLAVNPERLEVADSYKAARSFVNYVKRETAAHSDRMTKAVEAFDAAGE